ncbi:MAG: glycosyltransferase family 2 protein [Gemmatimonadota bacterium]|nr:glycosyltransferase family 2 protein [Gemmatimonadota bacterium]
MNPVHVSVVVPMFNEEESVPLLTEAVRSSLEGLAQTWELVFVDDGSTDRTASVVQSEAAGDPRIRLIQLARNRGQTPAMMAGFREARGDVIVSMDGDLQNDPKDIPALVAKLEEGYDLVAGWRMRRQDKLLTRKVPSWIANRLIARITGIPIRDNGCSLKAYRKTLLDRVTLYSEMHRFIPAIAALHGARIAQIPVRHHPRRFGKSKYGLGRTYRVLADLVTLRMLSRFRERPLLGFAWTAFGALAVGGAFGAAWLVALLQFREEKASALVFPAAAIIWLATAVFLLMLGLVAETIVRHTQQRRANDTPLTRRMHGNDHS